MNEMEFRTVGTPEEVRARLQALGWRDLSHWARAHGYRPGTVRMVLARWGTRADRPHGGIGRMIMRDLRATLAERRAPRDIQPVERAA